MNNIFVQAYIWGIVGAMLVAITGGQEMIFGLILIPDFSDYILPYSVSHMILLIFLGYRMPVTIRHIPGERVQTAGYLHTLIGFSTALLNVTSQDFVIGDIMGPIGSALLTSILGWFVGGEFSSHKSSEGVLGIKDDMDKLALEITGFAHAVKSAHSQYISTIHGASDEYKKLKSKQEEIILSSTKGLEEVESILSRLNITHQSLLKSLDNTSNTLSRSFGDEFKEKSQKVLENVNLCSVAFKDTANEAKNTSQYLSESRVLIEELDRLLKYVSTIKSSA